VSPANAAVLLGAAQTFTATVTNSDDAGVSWSVDGIPGGNTVVGTISSTGIYSAPADLPQNESVRVTATSRADATKSADSAVSITSDVRVSLSASSASVELGATQNFRASIASSAHPDAVVRWSVSGPACPSLCGAVDANGNFTAPQLLPNSTTVNLTAQSVADSSKQATNLDKAAASGSLLHAWRPQMRAAPTA
jgi:hypothetical protein